MNRVIAFLLLTLFAQLGLTAWLYQSERRQGKALASQTLVDAGPYLIDRLTISDGQGNQVELQRRGKQWLLPQLGELPANPPLVSGLLEKLTRDHPGWPVAHSIAARQRFQVADYHHQRKVSLLAQGSELGAVYLGTSPGFRKVHARNADRDTIYSVDLNLFQLPVRPGKWLQPGLLQVRAPLSIVADGYSLERSSGSWRLGTGESPDRRELQALLDSLGSLRVQGIAGPAERAAAEATEAALVLTIDGLTGTRTLELFQLEGAHFIRSSDYPLLFRLSAYDYDQLTGIDSAMLAGAK